MNKPVLSPSAFLTVDEAKAGLVRDGAIEEGAEDQIIDAVNAATAFMELETGRRLRERTWRTAVAIACSSTADQFALAGAGFLNLKVGDDALGANLAEGSRIALISSDASLTLDRVATATGSASVSFGSEPLQADGHGDGLILVPERPVEAVYAAAWLDDAGVATALDLTGARLDKERGRLVLTNDVVPEGDLNVRIECRAGYRPPSQTDRGHREDWNELKSLCLWLTRIRFQDIRAQRGRQTQRAIGPASESVPDLKIPAELSERLLRFRRTW